MIASGIYFERYSEFRQLVATLLGDNVFPKQANIIPYFGDTKTVTYVGVLPTLSVGTAVTVTVTGLSPIAATILESTGLYFVEFVAPLGDFTVETTCAAPQVTVRQYFRAVNFHTFTASLAEGSAPETIRGLQNFCDTFLNRLDTSVGTGDTLQGSASDTAANNNFGKLIGFERYAHDWSAADYRATLGGGTVARSYTRTLTANFSAGALSLYLPFTPTTATVVVTKNGVTLTPASDYTFTTDSIINITGSAAYGDVFVVTGSVVLPGLFPSLQYGGTFSALVNVVKSITGYELPDASVTDIQDDWWKIPSYVEDSYTDLLLHFIAAPGSTSIYDDSSARNTVTSTALLSNTTAKFLSTSARFTGTENITVASAPRINYDTNDFTIEFYVKFTSTTGDQTFVSRKDDDSNFWQFLKTGSDRLAFRSMVSGAYVVNVQTEMLTWDTNTWYHIMVSRTGLGMRIFRNGDLLSTFNIYAGMNMTLTSDIVFGYFARPSIPYTAHLTAYMDEVRFSSIARHIIDFLPRLTKYIGPKYYFAHALSGGTIVDVDPNNIYPDRFSLATTGTQVGTAATVQPCERKANTILAEIVSDGIATQDEPVVKSMDTDIDALQYTWLNPYAPAPDLGFDVYTDEHTCTGATDKTFVLSHTFNATSVQVWVNGVAITPDVINMTTREASTGQYVYPTNPGSPIVVGTFNANATTKTITLDSDVTVAAGDTVVIKSFGTTASTDMTKEFVVFDVAPTMPYTLQLSVVPMPGTTQVFVNGAQLDETSGDYTVSSSGLLTISAPALYAADCALITYAASLPVAWAHEHVLHSGSFPSTWTPAYALEAGSERLFVNGVLQNSDAYTIDPVTPHTLTFDATWLSTLVAGDMIQLQYVYNPGNVIIRQAVGSAYTYYLQTVHFNVNYTTGEIIWKTGVQTPGSGSTYLCSYTYFQKDLITNMLNRIKAATTNVVLRFTTSLQQSFIPGRWGGVANPGADVII